MNKRGLTLVKAVFLISLLMIFISLANSIFALNNDNEYVKEFEKGDLNYGKITIKDGINGNIAEYVLERNTDQCLIDCYAEGTAKNSSSLTILKIIISFSVILIIIGAI